MHASLTAPRGSYLQVFGDQVSRLNGAEFTVGVRCGGGMLARIGSSAVGAGVGATIEEKMAPNFS